MLADVARRAGLGRLLYRTWHAPLAVAERARAQGPLNMALARVGEAGMRRAASQLQPLRAPYPDAPPVYFLTGRRFVHQTLFCAASLHRHAASAVRVVAVDDGTLRDVDVELLRRVIPGVDVLRPAQIEAALDRRLPRARYPELRGRRLVYPHLRKLTDVHAAGGGWKLVLDSDMLFHARPELLLHWLSGPDRPLHMVDVEDAYGYSPPLLAELAGGPLPERVNVGLCGLCSDDVPWDALESWCATLVAREGTHYLLEQALVAMLVRGGPRAAAPADAYVVAPARAEVSSPTTILHHYTAESKAWYFRFGWQHLVRSAAPGAGDARRRVGEAC